MTCSARPSTVCDQTISATRRMPTIWRARVRPLNIRYLLISKRNSPVGWQQLPAPPLFDRIYSDDGADLWRVSARSNIACSAFV